MTRRGSPVKRIVLLVTCALVFAALGAGAIDVDLTYAVRSNRTFFPYGGQSVEITLNPPDGEWKFPEWVSDTPVYALLKLGDREHLIVLDKKKADDKFYSRLYFDANANRDLDDDAVYVGSEMIDRPEMYRADFNRIKTKIVVDGVELPYEFTPNVYCYLQEPKKPVTDKQNMMNFRMHTSVDCAYRGSIELGKQAYDVWIADGDGNGRFSDTVTPVETSDGRFYGTGDHLYLTAGGENLSYEQLQYLGHHLVLGGKVFRVQVSTPEGRLTLTPVTENLSKLVWPDQLVALEVFETESKTAVMLYREGKQAPIPEGRYQLLNYRLIKEDEQGDNWQLAAAGTKESPVVNAKTDHIAHFPLGEPFQPVVTVPQWARQNALRGTRDMQLSLDVHGSGGELITDLRHIDGGKTKIKLSRKDSQRPAEPAYKIISGEGEVVASGTFEYG